MSTIVSKIPPMIPNTTFTVDSTGLETGSPQSGHVFAFGEISFPHVLQFTSACRAGFCQYRGMRRNGKMYPFDIASQARFVIECRHDVSSVANEQNRIPTWYGSWCKSLAQTPARWIAFMFYRGVIFVELLLRITQNISQNSAAFGLESLNRELRSVGSVERGEKRTTKRTKSDDNPERD
jgi:hypothetical protein